MPPVFIAIAMLLTDIAEVIGVTATLAIFNAVLFVGASLVLGQISKMFQKGPSSSTLASQVASRTITSRQAIAPWRVMYGTNRVGGIITFLHTTGTNNEKLHIVITLSGHELNASSAMYFDGTAVPLDGSGNATGNFAGFVHAEFNAGTKDQSAFAGLVAAAPALWTSAYRQRGRAGWYVQLTWDQNKFPNGVPNITFDAQGRKVYDPRTGTIAFSNNAALCIADYLNNASFGLVAQTKFAFAASMLTASSLNNFNAANLIDGDVTTTGFDTNAPTGAGSKLTIDLGVGNGQEFRRFRMYANAAGGAWNWNINYSDDNITYHAAAPAFFPNVLGWSEVELAPNGAHRYWQISAVAMQTGIAVTEIEFYSSDVDSVQLISAANTCDEAVSILAGGTQNRFSIDGSFDTSEVPANVIGRMNSSMAGSVLYTAGKWGIYPGIWRAPTVSLTDADFRGGMTVQTRLTHRDLYNGVKGTFISPTNNWQPADYPAFQDATALKEDANEVLWLDVELPFTTNGAMAQRLSKIALRRVRHQVTVQGQFKLTAYQVQPLDVVQLSHPRFGWVNKTFEVTACTLAYVDDGNGSLGLGVDLTMREADSTIYDWSTADEVALNSPPVTVLPQNAITQPPTGLSVNTVEVIRLIDGIRMSFIGVSWTSPADQFVLAGGHIIVQYKKHTDVNWTDIGKQKGNVITALVGPVIDGTQYDIQIWAENSSGVASTTVTATVTPTGTAVTIDTIGDGTVYGRAGSTGKNMCPNPGFELNTIKTPLNSTVAVGAGLSDGWVLQSANGPPAFAALIDTGTPRSGANCLFIRTLNVTIPASTTYAANVATSKIPVSNGVIIRVQAWESWANTIAVPAGINITQRIGLLIYDTNDTLLTELTIDRVNASGLSAYALMQGALQLASPTVAYIRVHCGAFIANTTGSPITIPAGLVGDLRWDDISCVFQNTAFDLTPINTSGTFTAASPLSQSGATTTILIGASTMQFGDGQISFNSGSVNPGVTGTFYIYADDPTYSGGAVSYQFTNTPFVTYAANGRIYFGKITTIGGGGGPAPTGGGSGGGRVAL